MTEYREYCNVDNEVVLFNIAYLSMINLTMCVFFIISIFKDVIYNNFMYYVKDDDIVNDEIYRLYNPEKYQFDKVSETSNELSDEEDELPISDEFCIREENNILDEYISEDELSTTLECCIKDEKNLDELININNLEDNLEDNLEENINSTIFDYLRLYKYTAKED
jgi:hypothetical protein